MGGFAGGVARTRQDIWGLSRIDPWHPTIAWYEYAFRVLRTTTDVSDPLSLEAIANIHGTNLDPASWPSEVGPQDWNACQHFSWYFLPWHRMYLHYYETILRGIIDAAEGPGDWALPFWNYDALDPQTLALPPAFLQPQRPDGGDNALYVAERADAILQGFGVPEWDVELTGWPDIFTHASLFVPTFGGPMTGWSHFGSAMGHLEREPHGNVHVDVGGDFGFMSAFETAGLDPIFWLHHANIDRLWEIWRNIPGHADPQETGWTTAGFDFGFGHARRTYWVSDIVDTSASQMGYAYEGVPVFVPGAGGGGFALEGEQQPAPRGEPRLVGASEGEVPLGPDPAAVTIGVEPPGGLGLDAAPPEHVYVVLQNVHASTARNRTYAVHVGVPEGDDPAGHPELLAGRFSTFGVVGATQAHREEAGGGLTVSFDVTGIVRRLEDEGRWQPESMRVTVTPAPPPDPEKALALDETSDLRIGQIGVFYD